MAYDIRPLSFTEVLDRAFEVVRDQFWLVAGISAVAWVPYGVLLALAGPTGRVMQMLAVLLLMVVEPLANTALAVAVAGVYLGLPATVSEAYRATHPILGSLLGTYLLMYVFILLGILLVLPAIYFMVCWILVAPVIIVEERFGMAALRRSRTLVRGSWWKTFGMILVVGLITVLPAAALQVFWSFIPFFGPILNAATQAVTNSYGLVAIVIYYFDRRCRTENFDLRLLAQQIRSERAAAVPGTSLA